MKINFGMALALGILTAMVASYLYLPRVLKEIKSNPRIDYYISRPELTWQVFSQCKQRVDNADNCYQAYSAAVALAGSTRCDEQGIKLKYRFKLLIEHSNSVDINKEISKECQPLSP